MISQRVAQSFPDRAEFEGDYLILRTGKTYRVYADATGYSQVSGQVIKRGKVLRGADGKPATFSTVGQARAWIRAGRPIVDSRGNDIADFTQWAQLEGKLKP